MTPTTPTRATETTGATDAGAFTASPPAADDWTRVKPSYAGMSGAIAFGCGFLFLVLLVAIVGDQVRSHQFAGFLRNALIPGVPGGAYLAGLWMLRLDAERLPLVGPGGLQVYDRFGLYRTFRWDEITSARFERVRGVTMLMMGWSPKEDPLPIPCDLIDCRDFLRLVQRHVGDEHPMVVALKRG